MSLCRSLWVHVAVVRPGKHHPRVAGLCRTVKSVTDPARLWGVQIGRLCAGTERRRRMTALNLVTAEQDVMLGADRVGAGLLVRVAAGDRPVFR